MVYEGYDLLTERQTTGIKTHTHKENTSSWGLRRALMEKAMFVLDLDKWVGFRVGGEAEGHRRWWEQHEQWLLSLLCFSVCLSQNFKLRDPYQSHSTSEISRRTWSQQHSEEKPHRLILLKSQPWLGSYLSLGLAVRSTLLWILGTIPGSFSKFSHLPRFWG